MVVPNSQFLLPFKDSLEYLKNIYHISECYLIHPTLAFAKLSIQPTFSQSLFYRLDMFTYSALAQNMPEYRQ